MALNITHAYTSPVADGADPNKVKPSNWNATHVTSGTLESSNVTGNWPVSQLDNGTNASSATFWRGDGTWSPAGNAAGGLNTEVQYNSSGVISGDAGFTYNPTTDTATLVGGLIVPVVYGDTTATSPSLTFGNYPAANTIETHAGTASVVPVFRLKANSSAPTVGYGGSLEFAVQTSSSNYIVATEIRASIVSTSSGAEIFDTWFTGYNNGSPRAEMVLRGDGVLGLNYPTRNFQAGTLQINEDLDRAIHIGLAGSAAPGHNFPYINTRVTRDTNTETRTLMHDGDTVFLLDCLASTDFSWEGGGAMYWVVDGTPATNIMPTRFEIATNTGHPGYVQRFIIRPRSSSPNRPAVEFPFGVSSDITNVVVPYLGVLAAAEAPSSGFGASFTFNLINTGGLIMTGATIECVGTNFSSNNSAFDLVFKTLTGGSTIPAESIRLDSNQNVIIPPTTVALLGPSSIANGSRRTVTDSTATTFYTQIQGGGANVMPVFSDGSTSWRIG